MGVRGGVFLLVVLLLGGRALGAAPTLLVGTGDQSPLGLPFSRFSEVGLDDRGRAAFVGASAAIFHRTAAGLVRIVGAGDALDVDVLAGVGGPALGGGACLGFQAVFVGGGSAVFRRCATDFDVIASVGTPVAGGAFAGFGPTVAVGAGGQIAFTALLDDGTTGLFVAALDGGIREVTRTGAPAAAGGTLVAIRLVGLSASGHVGFRGVVTAGPDGLFVWDGAVVPVVQKLAVVNDASPAGGQFTGFGAASVNDGDVWAFRATVANRGSVSSDPVDGVFRADASGSVPIFSTVALEGDQTPLGGTIRQIPTSLEPAINSNGLIVFRCTLADASSSAAIFTAAPDGTLAKVVAVGETTTAGQLRRLREAILGNDDSVLLRATLAGGTPGLFVARGDQVVPLARLGETTDLGSGFRFTDASVRGAVEDAVFLGLQEGVYLVGAPGLLETVAVLGDPTPRGGTYAGFEPPAAGPGGAVVFSASVHGGRVSEALFAVGPRGAVPLVLVGKRVPGGGDILAFFPDTIDPLTHAGVGPGGMAFHASLERTSASAGVFLRTGGGLRSMARAGQRAPGGGQYVAFGTPAVPGGGRVAFVGQVRGARADTALFLLGPGAPRTLAAAGRGTRTRIAGTFASFDPPAASGRSVAFHARLAQPGVEGVFIASGRTLTAVAGTGDESPDNGHFRSFGVPTFAGAAIVFPAVVSGGSGFYRVVVRDALAAPDSLPEIVPVMLVGQASPLGGSFLALGAPSGNARGALAFTADLVGAGASSGVFLALGADGRLP